MIFAKNLTNNRRLFGHADVDALHDVTESVVQQEADQLVSGSRCHFIRIAQGYGRHLRSRVRAAKSRKD